MPLSLSSFAFGLSSLQWYGNICPNHKILFFFISYSSHDELASCLLNKYFTSAHFSLKGHSHHQPAVMSLLFLPSFLCLSYLHDLLFSVSLSPDSFIKFRPLLLRPLCLSSCSMWDMESKRKKSRFPHIPPPLNVRGSTGLLSTAHPSGWAFRFLAAVLPVLLTILGPQGNTACKKMWIQFWQQLGIKYHPFWAGFGLERGIICKQNFCGFHGVLL